MFTRSYIVVLFILAVCGAGWIVGQRSGQSSPDKNDIVLAGEDEKLSDSELKAKATHEPNDVNSDEHYCEN